MLAVVKWLFQKINTFPKQQRFVLGQQIETCSVRCFTLVIEANNMDSPEDAIDKLKKLNINLDILRGLLRIAGELRFISLKSLGYITEQIDEVGRICGSWIRGQKKVLSSKLKSES